MSVPDVCRLSESVIDLKSQDVYTLGALPSVLRDAEGQD